MRRISSMLLFAMTLGASPVVVGGDDPASEYETLVSRLKQGDFQVDFTRLRESFAETPQYNPFGAGEAERHREMVSLLENGDWVGALAIADGLIEKTFVNGMAHVVAGMCHDQMGGTKKAEFHEAVVRGLMNSICDGTDGRSPEAPCRVISIAEERFYLTLSGLEFKGQSLLRCGTGQCDRIDVEHTTSGESFAIYFDISIQMNRMRRED